MWQKPKPRVLLTGGTLAWSQAASAAIMAILQGVSEVPQLVWEPSRSGGTRCADPLPGLGWLGLSVDNVGGFWRSPVKVLDVRFWEGEDVVLGDGLLPGVPYAPGVRTSYAEAALRDGAGGGRCACVCRRVSQAQIDATIR